MSQNQKITKANNKEEIFNAYREQGDKLATIEKEISELRSGIAIGKVDELEKLKKEVEKLRKVATGERAKPLVPFPGGKKKTELNQIELAYWKLANRIETKKQQADPQVNRPDKAETFQKLIWQDRFHFVETYHRLEISFPEQLKPYAEVYAKTKALCDKYKREKIAKVKRLDEMRTIVGMPATMDDPTELKMP